MSELLRDAWCGESLAGHMQGLCHCPEIAVLRQQLAETHVHLDAQRTATYQAVKREHAAGRELALLKDAGKFIKQRAEIREDVQREATASPDTP